MDPDKCFEEILDYLSARQYREAVESAENLASWIGNGGFLPGSGKIDRQVVCRFVDWVMCDLRSIVEVDS